MPIGKSAWGGKLLALLAKDLRVEFRTRYAISTVLLFALTTLAAVSFALGVGGLPAQYLSVLFWVVILFSALSGLSHSFVKETETNTAPLLQLSTTADVVFFGKWTFNLVLLMGLEIILVPLFIVFLQAEIQNWSLFVLVLLVGDLGLVSATTLLAALVAAASARGALFSVLSLPVLIPLLIPLVQVTEICFAGGVGDSTGYIRVLFAYAGIATAGGWLLFPYVWRD